MAEQLLQENTEIDNWYFDTIGTNHTEYSNYTILYHPSENNYNKFI